MITSARPLRKLANTALARRALAAGAVGSGVQIEAADRGVFVRELMAWAATATGRRVANLGASN